MADDFSNFLRVIDGRPLVKASRLRVGALRARGVPAILLGVAGIVLAAGTGEALKRAASAIPETMQEIRHLLFVARSARELPSPR